MERPTWDEELLNELTKVMTDASICGLGQAAMNPVKQVMKHFRDDFAGIAPAVAVEVLDAFLAPEGPDPDEAAAVGRLEPAPGTTDQ